MADAGQRLVDLTHPFTTELPTFGDERPTRAPCDDVHGGFFIQRWTLTEHVGTHLDAPAHTRPGGRTATGLTLDEFVVPAVVIDVRARASTDPDTVVALADLDAHERRHGRIPARAAVLMHAGWARRWGDELAYRGATAGAPLDCHFPGFGAEACAFLLAERSIAGLGVDTLSTDPGATRDFPVHRLLADADRWGLENLANLDALPPRGATLTVGLVPLEEGSGGPCRAFASVPA